MRKTIEVSTVKAICNSMLLHSADSSARQREGVCRVLEDILHSAGAYKGFHYLSPAAMAASESGKTCGINNQDLPYDQWFAGTDHTRRSYI